MKKSKLQLAVSMVLLVIVCCPVAGCIGPVVPDTYYQSEDAIESTTPTTTEILNSYPQDRITVWCSDGIPNELSSWEVISKFRETDIYPYPYNLSNATIALLKIPNGMTFSEALVYCEGIDSVIETPRAFFLENDYSWMYKQNEIMIQFIPGTPYEIPIGNNRLRDSYIIQIPDVMTLPEAVKYYSNLDYVMYVDLVPAVVATLSNT